MDAHTQSIADRIKAANRGKVIISFIYPPIPWRHMDWCAYFDGDEPDDDGHMLCGYGETKAEALEDLLTSWEDSQP